MPYNVKLKVEKNRTMIWHFKKDTKDHILGFLCTGVESKKYDAEY